MDGSKNFFITGAGRRQAAAQGQDHANHGVGLDYAGDGNICSSS